MVQSAYTSHVDGIPVVRMTILQQLQKVTASFTRPADANAYAVGDIVSNSTSASTLMTFTDLLETAGGGVKIVSARLATNQKSIVPAFRVHLYNASNPTVSADNAAHRELYADEDKYIGFIDLPAMTTGTDTTNSTSSRATVANISIPAEGASGSRNVYALLETLTAFTPASASQFTLKLVADWA
jgi:hypothetical protein